MGCRAESSDGLESAVEAPLVDVTLGAPSRLRDFRVAALELVDLAGCSEPLPVNGCDVAPPAADYSSSSSRCTVTGSPSLIPSAMRTDFFIGRM